jgi:hypothetical protein
LEQTSADCTPTQWERKQPCESRNRGTGWQQTIVTNRYSLRLKFSKHNQDNSMNMGDLRQKGKGWGISKPTISFLMPIRYSGSSKGNTIKIGKHSCGCKSNKPK